MKQKTRWCDKPISILIGTLIGAIGGGILGIFAYYGQWLG